MPKNIGIIGLGYVGLTLTAALARAGHTVHAVDVQPDVVDELARGRTHIYEPGVDEVLRRYAGTRILVGRQLPRDGLDAAVICVSTPVDPLTHEPDLRNVAAATADVAEWCAPGTLVVVRSTVPIGACRRVVLPILAATWETPLLAMAPERTIQGQALRELVELPQIVGGLDDASVAAAVEVFGQLANVVVPVSSLEVAEMVKLANNCHTDLIYAFGNEVALIAERHGIDPLELIHAANVGYPRPDLSRPGYVGGGCLSKDPYLMLASSAGEGTFLIDRARELNEHLPLHVARQVVELLAERHGSTAGKRLAVLGWAYKGTPPTDDMRGTPIATMIPVFREAGLTVLGHDPMVTPEVIRAFGGEPISLEKAFSDSDAVLVITDHPDYRALRVEDVVTYGQPELVYDSWRVLNEKALTAAGIRYAGLGYRVGAPA
ncbi:nucleotide sugar dehydrogenase [Hamadaea sp. NPDC051192]|uniref:nucleotide sugar dehydrogenase n=1 Tax=Hamadaea sp. NPDC051192 TaxID=3154940 RepID=UPI00341E5197